MDSVVCLVYLRTSIPMWCADVFTQTLAEGYLTQTSKRRSLHDGDAACTDKPRIPRF